MSSAITLSAATQRSIYAPILAGITPQPIAQTLTALFDGCNGYSSANLGMAAGALREILKHHPATSVAGTFKHAVVDRLVTQLVTDAADTLQEPHNAVRQMGALLESMHQGLPWPQLTQACVLAKLHREIPAVEEMQTKPLATYSSKLQLYGLDAEEADIVIRFLTHEGERLDERVRISFWVRDFANELQARQTLLPEIKRALQACRTHPLSYILMKRLAKVLFAKDAAGKPLILRHKIRELYQTDNVFLPKDVAGSLAQIHQGTVLTAHLSHPRLTVQARRAIDDLERMTHEELLSAAEMVGHTYSASEADFLKLGKLTIEGLMAPLQVAIDSKCFLSFRSLANNNINRPQMKIVSPREFEKERKKFPSLSPHCQFAFYDFTTETIIISEVDESCEDPAEGFLSRTIAVAHEFAHAYTRGRDSVEEQEAVAGMVDGMLEFIIDPTHVGETSRYLGMHLTQLFVARRVPYFF